MNSKYRKFQYRKSRKIQNHNRYRRNTLQFGEELYDQPRVDLEEPFDMAITERKNGRLHHYNVTFEEYSNRYE